MDVQMRLAAFAGIADFTDLLTLSEAVPSGDPKRSLPEMAKQDVESVASQKNMVARRMALIHLRNPHVGAAVDGHNNLARTGSEDWGTEDRKAGRIGGHDAVGAQSPPVDRNEINAIAAAAKVRVQR
jgi:hypothetical protein